MRERKFIRKCPCGCGKDEYDLGLYRGFHLFQKPFFYGWYIYGSKLHPDELDVLLMAGNVFPNTFFDDTERLAHPSLEEIEQSVIEQIDSFWEKKRVIIEKIGRGEITVKEN